MSAPQNVEARATTTAAQRVAAKTAGYALLSMAITAVFAYFIAVESLVVAGDGPGTAARIRESEGLFRAGVAGFMLVASLDIVVACALFVLLEPVNRLVSLVAAGFRLVYAAILGVAVAHLLNVLSLLERSGDQILGAIEAFNSTWGLGLGLFGVHLALIGYLFRRSGYIPRLVSLLVVVAGVGYVVDSLGAVILDGYALSIASVAFVGEVLLMLWLLLGFRHPPSSEGERPTANREAETTA